MSIIQVNCIDQVLTITNSPVIASGGVNEDFVQFSFDSNWDGFGKLAMFYRHGVETTVYESAIASDGRCEIPHEVMSDSGKICFGVTGVNGTDVRTSEVLVYDIEKGSPRSGQTSEPAPTSVYEQMLAIAEEINAKANQIDSQVAAVQTAINEHVGDSTIHVTSSDKTKWNSLESKLTYKVGDTITFDSVTGFGRTWSSNPDVNTVPSYATAITVSIPLPKPLDIGVGLYTVSITNPSVANVIGNSVKGRILGLDNRTISSVPGTLRITANYPHSVEITYNTVNEAPLKIVDETLDTEEERNIPEETVASMKFRNLKISFTKQSG